MTSHNSDSLKRKPCQTKKTLLHDIPQLRIAPNSARHVENKNLILLNQKSPLHDIPQLQIAPNSARHIFKTKTFLKKPPITSHTLLHHETLKQKQILLQKKHALKRIRTWDLEVMSRTQQAQISTQWNFDWQTIEYRGFSTRPAQSCCSIRHGNLLCKFSSFHFLAKNSLTLTPSETECFTHVCSLLDVPLSKTVWPSGLRRWLKAPFRKGVGSNPTAVTFPRVFGRRHWRKKTCLFRAQKAECASPAAFACNRAELVFFFHPGTKWCK